jgi:outer membrane immunogenic protein
VGAAAPFGAAPAYDWTGLYVGGQIGVGEGDSVQFFTAGVGGSTGRYDLSGVAGGPLVGFNWQFAQHLVAGAEADFSWADLSGSGRTTATYGCGTICSTTVNWFATERARLGYAFDNGVLLYATGGAAQVDVRPDLDGYIRSSTRFGWAAGAGVEYRFNRNWSAKAEYLFVNVDDYVWTNATNGLIDCRGLNCSTDSRFSLVRFGVNYRFDWAAPTAAKD